MRFVILISSFLTAAFAPLTAHAAAIGFASSGISFSQEPTFAGTSIKVYSVVVNNQYSRLSAVVAFLDNNQEFGRAGVEVLMEEARQVQVGWTPNAGQHVVVAKFVSAVAFDAQGNGRSLTTTEIESVAAPVSRTVTIDSDSDKDGIGDQDEIRTYHTGPLTRDSDGDGLSDYDEIFKYKTDPNKADTDSDGMNDGDEVRAGRNPLVPDAPPVVAPPVTAPIPTPIPSAKPEPASELPAPKIKKSQKKESAPTAPEKTTPAIVSPIVTTASTTPTSTPFETVPPVAAEEPESSTTNWVVVLSMVAGLLAVAGAVSSGLAWRERNRY